MKSDDEGQMRSCSANPFISHNTYSQILNVEMCKYKLEIDSRVATAYNFSGRAKRFAEVLRPNAITNI